MISMMVLTCNEKARNKIRGINKTSGKCVWRQFEPNKASKEKGGVERGLKLKIRVN